MRVTVKLFATLVRFRPDIRSAQPFEVELPEDAAVLDLIDYLKIPPEETHVIFINNIIQEPDTKLRDSDVIGLFPPVGGG
jgi:molybdopterin converting factor small subunit